MHGGLLVAYSGNDLENPRIPERNGTERYRYDLRGIVETTDRADSGGMGVGFKSRPSLVPLLG
jgi:hypothetical protein